MTQAELERFSCRDTISTSAWSTANRLGWSCSRTVFTHRILPKRFYGHVDPPPIGYDVIARTYNAEPNFNSSFSEWLIGCMRPEPSPYTFFGNSPPLPPLTATQQRTAEITAALADSALAHRRRIQAKRMGGRQWQEHTQPVFGSRGRGGSIGGDRRGGMRAGKWVWGEARTGTRDRRRHQLVW